MKLVAILLLALITCGIVNIANAHGADISYIWPVIASLIVGWLVG